ncbi:MAG: hypothetical protein QOD69_3131 [Solirubrobacteraceae bacterium]|nr:hypothetical protein [Solirubrobacteraceae bacterium]
MHISQPGRRASRPGCAVRARRPAAEIADQVALRFNPLPAVALGCAAAELARLAELDAWRHERREEICALLHARAGEAEGDERTRLISLKRDVHNDRLPRDPGAAEGGPAAAWVAARREADALRSGLLEGFEERLRRERCRLRELCAVPTFQRALALSSSDLAGAAQRYAELPLGDHRARQRKSEPSFVQYLGRAQLRTSPFSWYTAVAVGRWVDDAELPLAMPSGWHDRTQVDHALVRRLLAALVRRPEIADCVALKVAPGAHAEGDRLIFDIFADNPENQPHVYGTVQRRGSVRWSPALATVVAWVRDAPGPTRTDLLTALGGATEANTAFVDAALQAGLLLPDIPVADQTPDILGDCRSFLGEMPGEPAAAASEALTEIGVAVAGFGQRAPRERTAALGDIRAAAARAFAAAGAEPPRSPLLYEDVVAAEPIGLDRAAWEPVLEDLRALGPFLELFDRTRVLKAMVRSAFVQRYGPGGRCENLAEFEGAIAEAYEHWRPGDASPLAALERDDSELGILRALQDEVVAHLAERSPDAGVELELDATFVGDVVDRMPAGAWQGWSSYSVFGQPATSPGRVDEFVVNHVYNGLGEYLTRFLELVDESVTERLRARVRDFFGDDRRVAEMRPVFGFNANLHPLIAPLELGEEPTDEGLAFDDLELVHEPIGDILQARDRATGEPVESLYLGFLVPYLLPQRMGFLYALTGNGWVDMPFPDRLEETAERDGAIRAYPRLRFGRVVLMRRRWYVPLRLVPRPEAGEELAAYWLRLNAWRLAAGMPDSVFFKVAPARPNDGDDGGDWLARMTFRRDKPQHVDFTSALHAKRFGKVLPATGDDELLFEETAPDPAAALISGPDGPHVTEAVIEIDRRAEL